MPDSTDDPSADHAAESESPKPEKGRAGGIFKRGCLTAMVLFVVLVAALIAARDISKHRKEEAQQERARTEFAPVFEKMEEAVEQGEGSGIDYDLDQTIRVLHGMDQGIRGALERDESLKEYLAAMAAADYRGVAPEVIDARTAMLDVLYELYAVQLEEDAQQELWEYSGEMLLAMMSVVEVDAATGPLGPVGGLSVDRAQAQAELELLREKHEDELDLIQERARLETDLFDAMLEYADAYYKYVEEWDRLCVMRDRAYLAAHDGNWGAAIEAADAAITLAPHEKEAHLLKALALIESGTVEGAQVENLLHGYIQEHPDSTAPAQLLLGVHHARSGNRSEASLQLQQAAAYYPRQSDQLSDLLDPYKQRAFLRKTREGNFIVGQYQSTMLGAGYFSPDLQMARIHFAAGEHEEGQTKVKDHFARRRSQEQWELVLSDIQFCEATLGDDFRTLFPEDSYLDLIVKPTLFGDKIKVSIDNRSPQTLHNATLVHCIQFTDMHPDDYQTFSSPTQPAVMAHDRTDFGELEVAFEWFGETKNVDHVVTHRAVLISNEAVDWVDTDQYKIAEAAEFREMRRKRAAGLIGGAAERTTSPLVDKVLDEARARSELKFESKVLGDKVTLELPREFSILKPVFRLEVEDETIEPKTNLIQGDKILLEFQGIPGTESAQPGEITLVVSSVLADLELTFGSEGGGSYRLLDVGR